jgi:hypothetical protein
MSNPRPGFSRHSMRIAVLALVIPSLALASGGVVVESVASHSASESAGL